MSESDVDADLDAMLEVEEARLEQQTDEGAQEMRRPVHRDVVIGGGLWPEDDDTMIINMGPQHPSTHGVLRVMMELDGETVLRASPVIGYLHTGMEKTGEELTYVQGATNVTRMDYLAPLSNELVYSLAVERLLDIEVPPRATWIRMLLVELNRISSHLLFQATNGMDLGAVSMMLYGWRERELTLRYLEKITGLRMNHNFIRPGGVAADLPDDWAEDVLELCDDRREGRRRVRRAAQREPDLGRPHRRRRRDHDRRGARARRDRADPALDRLSLGPPQVPALPRVRRRRLRRRVRRERRRLRPVHHPALRDPRVGEDRARSASRRCRRGDYRVQDRKVTPPPRARIDESMEALIHHFKLFTEGFRVPAGETYVAIESPRGEIGCYLVSDGTGKPVRLHIRGPSFYNLQSMEAMVPGTFVADAVAIISSIDPDHGRGGPLMPFTAPERKRAEEIVARYPHSKSALLPLLHMAQERDGWVTPQAMEDIAEFLGVTPAIVLGTCSFYTMFKREHVGRSDRVGVHEPRRAS